MKFEDKYICDIETFDVKWEVVMKSRDSLTIPNGTSYDGMTVNSLHEIHIANDLDRYRLTETIYHEVTHAFNNSLYGMKETFTHEEMCDFIGRYGMHIHKQAQKILTALENGSDK